MVVVSIFTQDRSMATSTTSRANLDRGAYKRATSRRAVPGRSEYLRGRSARQRDGETQGDARPTSEGHKVFRRQGIAR